MTDAALVVKNGAAAGDEFPVEGELILGREPGSADLVLDDPGVSRRHAAVRAAAGRITVEDLGSSNGTFVNGRRISGTAELADADEVRLGKTTFSVRRDGAGAPLGVAAAPAAAQPGPVPRRLAPHPTERGNLPALSALFLGPLSIFLLVFSTGASFFVALPCAIAAIALGSVGVRKVDRGETGDHRTLARIGRATGIVGAALSTLVLVAFLVVTVVLDATADSLGGIVEQVRDEINGVDVPSAPDLNPPDVTTPGVPSGGDSGGTQAP